MNPKLRQNTTRAAIGRVGLAMGCFMTLCVASVATAQETESAVQSAMERPQVFAFENFPFPVTVPRGLLELEPIGEPFEYDRRLPIFGKEAADRGIALPRPWGVSLLGVSNRQVSVIDELSVALSIDGTTPPQDADLVDLGFVTMDDSVSETTANQVKVDLWLFPFLNFYATRGRVTGKADLTVNVDLDTFNEVLPGPGIPGCGGGSPVNPQPDCGDLSWDFDVNVDSDTYTLGLVGIKNWGRTVATLSGSYTFSDSRKDTSETIIEVATAGARVGRLYTLTNDMTITPYLGVNYTYSDNIVRGTQSSPETLPNGEPLIVRFETRQRNKSNWSGTLGFAWGINDRWSANFDFTGSENLQRSVVGLTARF